jgi:hypothetical protein
MTLHGQVRGGVIVFDPPVTLSEGTEVQVQVIQSQPEVGAAEPQSLYERLKPFVGAAKGLPADLAAQHDHYLYGTSKRP